MQFKKGVNVKTELGDKVGDVDRVVIDPGSGEVTHLVVRKGGLLSKDKVVPLDWVQRTNADEVILNVKREAIENAPDFLETYYTPLSRAEMERSQERMERELETEPIESVYWYPPMGATPVDYPHMFPASVMFPYEVEEKEQIPQGTVALKEGAKVISKDGKEVGKVEKVLTEDEKERVTGLLITKGVFNREKKMIPANWIGRIKEDGVELTVASDFVESLKDFQEG